MKALLHWLCALAIGLTAGCAGLPGMNAPPAWELPPPAAQEAPVVQVDRLTDVELENGLRILVLEDHRLPRVAMGLAVRRGAGIEPIERAGLASLLAEVMKRGAGARDALALARAVEDLGASFGVSAGWDVLSVDVAGLSRDQEALFEVLADVALRPRIEVAEVTKARDEQLAVLERAVDAPGTLVAWYAERSLYPEHRYGLPLGGSKQTVGGLTPDDVRAFHEQLFVPGGAVLYASGALDAEAFIARAREIFGPSAWPEREMPAAAPAPPVQVPESTRVVIIDRPDVVQSRIEILHEGMARGDEERIPGDLMNKVLGGSGFASRLMQRVRSDEGLTYSVWSGFSMRRRPGPFRISTFTRVEETRRVVDLLLEEMRRIRSEPPQEEELGKASSLALGLFGLGLETSDAVLASLVNLDVYGLPKDSLDTYRARVRDVDVAAVSAAADRLIHPDRVVIVVLGPAEALSAQLEGLGPIEIIEP